MDIFELRQLNSILTQNKIGYNKVKCEDLYNYQEMVRMRYPKLWLKVYNDKWPVRIIYYDKNNKIQTFEFYVDRNKNMGNIKKMFNNFLNCQELAIINSFGLDIAENIIKYMPSRLDKKLLDDNYIYVHIRPYSKQKYGNEHIINITERTKVPDEMTVNQVHGKISSVGTQQESRYTILRLRYRPGCITRSF